MSRASKLWTSVGREDRLDPEQPATARTASTHGTSRVGFIVGRSCCSRVLPPHMRMRLRRNRCYAIGLVFAGLAVALLVDRYPPVTHGGDFIKGFYPAGKQVLHGYLHYTVPRVYDYVDTRINRYPPIAAVLVALFAWLPVKTAAIVWWITGAALIALTGWCLTSLFAHGARRVMASAMLVFFFVAFGPLAGWLSVQIDVWIFAMVGAAFVLSTRETRRGLFASGALFGIAASIKIYPLLTIAIIAWYRRDDARPFLAGAATTILACIALPLLLLGPSPFSHYLHALSPQGSPVLAAFPFAFGFLNIAFRALVVTPYTTSPGYLDPSIVKALFVLFVIAVLAFLAARFKPRQPDRGALWSVALMTTAVCSPFLEEWHLAWLALIPVFLAADAATKPHGSDGLWPVAVGLVACNLVSIVLRGHFDAALSLVTITGVGVYIVMRQGIGAAVFGCAIVFLGAPALLNISAFWARPISLFHVLLGSADYLALLLAFAVGVEGFTPRIQQATEPHLVRHFWRRP
jgi:hypothetical protein